MKIKKNEREESIKLREKGLSLRNIAKKLNVARSSVSVWVRDVPISEEKKAALRKKDSEKWRMCCQMRSDLATQRRVGYQEAGRNEINRNDWEHAAGCMLFWAEGSKHRHRVTFTNCDQEMMFFFVSWLKKFYGVKSEDFALRVQYHEGNSADAINGFWIKRLSLHGAKVGKGTVKKRVGDVSKYENGICTIDIYSTELVNKIWGSVQEYVGFSAPEVLKNYPARIHPT